MLNNTNSLNNQKLKTFLSRMLICIISLFCVFSMLVENYADASVIELDESPASYIVDTLPDTMEDLADSVDLSDSAYFPSIGSQQGGSCVAWAIAYYQFTYEVAKQEKLNAKNFNNVYSPKYVWNYLNDGTNKGISIKECYNFIKQNGCIKWSEFPQSWLAFDWYTNNDNDKMLNTIHTALDYRIDKYHENRFVESQTTVPLITNNNSEYIYNMKRLLAEEEEEKRKVLCISMFMEGAVIDTLPTSNLYQGNPYVVKYTKAHASSHFITIVGYNDNIYYDLNGDGQRQDFEYGAFLAADSRGTGFPNRNNGYIWIMYDALNEVSNATNLNPQERRQVALDNTYWYIDVKKCQPKLTVEVTVSQQERDEFSISLVMDDGTPGVKEPVPTFVNAIGGNRSFNGGTPSLQSYTFVFDYEAHDLYDGAGYHYGVKIKDLNENDSKSTVVQKIVWKVWNEEEEKLQEIGIEPKEALNGTSKEYYATLEKISIQQDHELIQKGRTRTPTVVVEPSDLSFSYTLESSNTSKITVNDKQITAIETGYADITATVVLSNGKVLTASCGYTVLQGFGNTRDDAHAVLLDTPNAGAVIVNGDESWLKFTATETDDYVFCVQSINNDINTKADIYVGNSSTPISGSFINYNGIFVVKARLTKDQTYYIKIYNQNGSYDDYRLRINKSVVEFDFVDNNPDARHIQLEAVVSSLYDTLYFSIDGEMFVLSRANTNLDTFDNTSIEYKVSVDYYDTNRFYTKWTIHMDVSSADSFVGVTNSVSGSFLNSNFRIESEYLTASLFAYKSSFVSDAYGKKLDEVISGLAQGLPTDTYSFSVYSASENHITATSTTRAATGMKIVRKITETDQIVEVYHVIVLGDLEGDGYIDNTDASIILSYDAGTGSITAIQAISGDVNTDGSVDNSDASLILNFDAGLGDIEQTLTVTEVPEGIYFGTPVAF